MGLVLSYEIRTNEKHEHNARKTPNLTTQKQAEGMKNTKKELWRTKETPTNDRFCEVLRRLLQSKSKRIFMFVFYHSLQSHESTDEPNNLMYIKTNNDFFE